LTIYASANENVGFLNQDRFEVHFSLLSRSEVSGYPWRKKSKEYIALLFSKRIVDGEAKTQSAKPDNMRP
jgi:hypothetical protein